MSKKIIDDFIPKTLRDAYWKLVRDTMTQVFGTDRTLATRVRRALSTRPYGEQSLVYHDEALNVAADLSGVRRISNRRMQHYIRLRREAGMEPSSPMLRRIERSRANASIPA